MKLVGLTLLAAAVSIVSAEVQVDFMHYSMDDCNASGGTQIGGTDHLKANEDVKNFDDDDQPVFHSFKLHVTEDADELDHKYCEITVCTQFDCKFGKKTSVGNIKGYDNDTCVTNPDGMPGRAVDFRCRDKETVKGTRTSVFSADPTHNDATETVTVTRNQHDSRHTTTTTTTVDETASPTKHEARSITVAPARPHICDVCDMWWWDPRPDDLRDV